MQSIRHLSSSSVPSASIVLEKIAAQQQQLLVKWGFSTKSVTLSNGETMDYLERGTAACSSTLLMCHGLTQDKTLFAPFAAAMRVPRSVRIIIPDAIGHGSRIPSALKLGDDLKGWSNEERADDVLSFLDSINAPESLDIFGYSMGGGVALNLLAKNSGLVNKACLLSPAGGLTEEAIDETNSGLIRYAYRSIPEAEGMLEAVGFHPAQVKSRAPLLLASRIATGTAQNDYWARMWSGLANGLSLSGVGMTISEAMLDSTLSLSQEAFEKTSTQVAVIQGSKDRIIHQDVPKRILEGLTSDRCSVHYLDAFGHSGNPDDENGYIAQPAGPIAAKFFQY
ncbi:hypothetical protein TrCOL_g8800 [Triparma columacea]|uniref:AB hydrolase-1 domain-containing protein n=1 Tax=Triparma columacea TaxID=722753 RepID=A0A9W7GPA5_9STRA|nr:hypothetical protein TrCOL_g8800 [Triparma columacea]